MNTGETSATIDFSRYAERTAAFTRAVDVLSGTNYEITGTPAGTQAPAIPPMQMWVLELKK
jgi:hypothetical protein